MIPMSLLKAMVSEKARSARDADRSPAGEWCRRECRAR